jgi:hypothetical protein
MPLVEQELLTLPEHLSSPPIFSGVHVTRSFILYACFVDRYNLLILIIFPFHKFPVFACLFKTHSLVDYECTWLCLFQKRVVYTKSKKSLKIPNGQSESVYRTDNTMGEKCTKGQTFAYTTARTENNCIFLLFATMRPEQKCLFSVNMLT